MPKTYWAAFGLCALLLHQPAAQSQDTNPFDLRAPSDGFRIIERGQDFAVFTRLIESQDSAGNPIFEEGRVVMLGNSMHYFEDGEWRVSEDLVESFPDGAIARRGPHKAIFTHDLNSENVFDIECADGTRVSGGVRAIQLTDYATGNSVTVGEVKESAIAEIIPPNRIIWRDAFHGLAADVMLVWSHNSFSQSIIVREKLALPEGFDARATRLDVLTEFTQAPEPVIIAETLREEGRPEILNHGVIELGPLLIPPGTAFPVQGQEAVEFGGWQPEGEGAPVIKQWLVAEDGRAYLLESVAWEDLEPQWEKLAASHRPTTMRDKEYEVASTRAWPARISGIRERAPIQVASLAYRPAGVLVDFVTLSGNGNNYTFLSTETYFVNGSFTVNSGYTATFQAGTVIKYNDAGGGSYLILAGAVSFPASGARVVFTSKTDSTVGQIVQHGPITKAANRALYVYNTATIQNAAFLWCRMAMELNFSGTYTVSNTYFQDCDTGIFHNASTGWLNLSNVRICKVTSPLTGYTGRTSGASMISDCVGIENSWTGESAWSLSINSVPVTPGWPANPASATPEVQGFASLTSVNIGSALNLYIDVRNGNPDYKIEFYRMGWYSGTGGRKMTWYDAVSGSSIKALTKASVKQPIPVMSTTDGSIDCLATTLNGSAHIPWTNSYTLTVPSNWLSGVYLAKVTTLPAVGTGRAAYIIFAVRDDARSSDFYFQSSVTTFQAYNPWGGKSLYTYPNNGPGTKVSFNRPYAGSSDANLAYGTGAGEFLVAINTAFTPAWEYNALRWIEKHGFDVTYCTSVDTHVGWPSGKTTKAFLSVGHDEYWSAQMRSNVEAKRNAGVNLAFLGSNVCYWRATFDSGLRAFSVNKVANADLWRGPVINNPENSLVGIGYVYNSLDANMVVRNPLPSGSWGLFNHTGLAPGASATLPGLLGYEVDGCWNLPTPACVAYPLACPPAGTNILAESSFVSPAGCTIGSSGRAYMTLTRAPVGSAHIIATGSMQWVWGLDDFGYSTVPPTGSRVHPVGRQIT